MTSHTYRIGMETRLQRTGGPAGLRFTGSAAKCTMNSWRRKMLELCREVGLRPLLTSKYVDDCTNIVGTLKVGAVWDRNSNRIIMDDKQR